MDAKGPYKFDNFSKAFKLKIQNHLKFHKSICSVKDQCFQCKESDKSVHKKNSEISFVQHMQTLQDISLPQL